MKKINDELLLKMIEDGKQGKECAEHFGCSPAAISKRLKRLSPPPLPPSLENLTEQQRRFCIEMADGKTRTQSALAAYECSSLNSAKTIGNQLMLRDNIQKAISEIMAEEGLTRRYRVRKLRQHVDSQSPDVSLKALDQTFKLDRSYATEQNREVKAYIQINLQTGERVDDEGPRDEVIETTCRKAEGEGYVEMGDSD
jgi:phage terminase small subunit